MSIKKDFTETPAGAFIAADTKATTKPQAKTSSPRKKNLQEVPFGYVVAPEPKTERVPLLMKKSVKELVKRDSEDQEISVNEVINHILEEYYKGRG